MSDIVGVNFIEINSSLISAQSRPRYYFNKNGLEEFINQNLNIDKAPTKDGIVKLFDVPKTIINEDERQRSIYALNSKSPTLLARTDTTKILDGKRIRKITPLESERLQKIPDNYTSSCSDTQRYKMIGNAFNVDTIVHILKGLENPPLENTKQAKLFA